MPLIDRSIRRSLLLCIMLMLPIGLGFMSIAHSVEFEQEVHQHHQCSVYDLVKCSITYPPVAFTAPQLTNTIQTYSPFELTDVYLNRPRSRSPPVIASFSHTYFD